MRPDEGGFSLSHCGHAHWTHNPIESGADRDAAAAAASMRLVPRRIQYSQCSFIHAHVPQHGGPLSEVRGNGAVVSTCSSSIHVPQHLRTARVIAHGSSTGRPRTHAVLGGVESTRRGGTGESRGSGGRRHTGRLHASAHHGGTGESRGEGEQRPAVGAAACKCSPRRHRREPRGGRAKTSRRGGGSSHAAA